MNDVTYHWVVAPSLSRPASHLSRANRRIANLQLCSASDQQVAPVQEEDGTYGLADSGECARRLSYKAKSQKAQARNTAVVQWVP